MGKGRHPINGFRGFPQASSDRQIPRSELWRTRSVSVFQTCVRNAGTCSRVVRALAWPRRAMCRLDHPVTSDGVRCPSTATRRESRRYSPRRPKDEENVPTEQEAPCKAPRLPAPHGGPRRSASASLATGEGPPALERVIEPLRSAGEFRTLRATGRRVTNGPITMIVCDADSADRTQVAYAISRRVGTAVRRNRLRRQLRALLAGFDKGGSLPSSRYLVICQPQAAHLDHSGLSHCLEGVIQRVSSAA
jgi:ribonuclease P protein component